MIRYVTTCFLLTNWLASAQQGVPSRITFVVKDEAGNAVTHAMVDGCFPDLSDTGDAPSHGSFTGSTDTNGLFTVEGDAVIGVYARFTKTGYYSTAAEQNRDGRTKLRRQAGWSHDRWDSVIHIKLKRLRNPLAMLGRTVENPYVDLRERTGKFNLGNCARYDLLVGGFLPPNGNGVTPDMDFAWRMTPPSGNREGGVDYDSVCEIQMTNVVDGICRGVPDGSEGGKRGSSYISAYDAPLEGYTNVLSFSRNVHGTKAEGNDDRHYLYYFRIRTQTNELGQVTNALYGKIYGQINGRFSYYLNPTPNDRNLEFDPKRNLFTNLKSTEKVTAP